MKFLKVPSDADVPHLRLFKRLILMTLPVFLIFAGCRKDVVDNVHPGPNEVWLQNTAFSPSSITVKVNTTVTWINKDGMDHTVTSYTNVFDSGNLHSGLSFSYKFTVAGSYPYLCMIHTNMLGTVIVE